MMIIKVDNENKVRLFGASDYRIEYDVKRSHRGLYCRLNIGDQCIIDQDMEVTNLAEMRDSMEALAFTISDFMCVSAMGNNDSVFRIIIDPKTLIASIRRDGYGVVFKNYGM